MSQKVKVETLRRWRLFSPHSSGDRLRKDKKSSLFSRLLLLKKVIFQFCFELQRHRGGAERWFSALWFHCWMWSDGRH